jgi:hypothetical protein
MLFFKKIFFSFLNISKTGLFGGFTKF